MSTRKLQRNLYLAQRTLGDIDAAKRGTLLPRLIKRAIHRKEIRLARKAKLW